MVQVSGNKVAVEPVPGRTRCDGDGDAQFEFLIEQLVEAGRRCRRCEQPIAFRLPNRLDLVLGDLVAEVIEQPRKRIEVQRIAVVASERSAPVGVFDGRCAERLVGVSPRVEQRRLRVDDDPIEASTSASITGTTWQAPTPASHPVSVRADVPLFSGVRASADVLTVRADHVFAFASRTATRT